MLELRKLIFLDADDPDTLASMANLAATYQLKGMTSKAIPLQLEVLELQKSRLGPEHHDTLASMNNLAGPTSMSTTYRQRIKLYGESTRLHETLILPSECTPTDSRQ